MATTPRWGLRYPLGSDAPDVPLWMNRLATDLDGVAMDDQGLLSARPTSSPGSPGKKGRYYHATDTGQLYRDTGTSWLPVHVPGGAPPVVTSLPSSPVEGQEVYLLVDQPDASSAYGGPYVWHVKYRSANLSAYKWNVVAATPLRHEAVEYAAYSSSSWGDLPAVDACQITAPIGGDYVLEYGATIECQVPNANGGGSGMVSPKIGAGSAGTYYAVHTAVDMGEAASVWRSSFYSTIPAGTVCKLQYRAILTGGYFNFGYRMLHMRPVRVG